MLNKPVTPTQADQEMSDAEYEKWGQYICPCNNPWCEPLVKAECLGRKYTQHKAAVRRWLKDG